MGFIYDSPASDAPAEHRFFCGDGNSGFLTDFSLFLEDIGPAHRPREWHPPPHPKEAAVPWLPTAVISDTTRKRRKQGENTGKQNPSILFQRESLRECLSLALFGDTLGTRRTFNRGGETCFRSSSKPADCVLRGRSAEMSGNTAALLKSAQGRK